MLLFSRVLKHHGHGGSERTSPSLTPTSSRDSTTRNTRSSTPISLSQGITSAAKGSSSSLLHSSSSHGGHPDFTLSIKLESPPIVLYGQPHESTGSILTGLLKLDVAPTSGAEEFELESVTLFLEQSMKYTKPFMISSGSVTSCKDCSTKKTVLARWDVLTGKALFPRGEHAYPFSHLVPGSLPASTKLGLASSCSYIKYDIVAVATCPGSSSREISVKLPLNISRSILRTADRNSLRVFPPTEITASAVLPNVIYPKSTFPIELRLENVVSSKMDKRWRMRKLTWRIEEQTKVKALVCEKHLKKLKLIEDGYKEKNGKPALSFSSKHEPGSDGSPSLTPSTSNNGGGSDGPKTNANYHHSTILTGTLYGISPSIQYIQQRQHYLNLQAEAEAHTGAAPGANPPQRNTPQIQDNDDDVEQEPVENSSAPARVYESFIEDFIHPQNRPRANNTESNMNASSSSSSIPRAQATSIARPPAVVIPEEELNHEDVYLEETRTISHGELRSGWKSDFSGRGRVELVGDINALGFSTGVGKYSSSKTSNDSSPDETQEGLRYGANVSCDIDDPTLGVFVNHTLVVELVVAEELIHTQNELKSRRHRSGSGNNNNGLTPVDSSALAVSATTPNTNSPQQTQASTQTQYGVPTGSARVLRMQFKLIVTERSGLGIAWDDEVPPTYEDVRTLSPPTYQETSIAAIASPAPNTLSPMTSAMLRQTPHVLYGVGETPIVGNFTISHNNSIDHIVDLDDLRL